MKTVTIIGLGYVGLPLACLTAEKGYETYGVDIDQRTVDLINKGISPIEDRRLKRSLSKLKGKIKVCVEGENAIKRSDIVIICVPTPVDSDHAPDITHIKSATNTILKGLHKGQLVIIESTVFPGTAEDVIIPILEESGLTSGDDFYLAHCPERVDLGNNEWTIKNLPRVIGGINKKSTKKAIEFYRTILDAETYELSSIKAAEATKLIENAFRDVNIAFINEVAKSFDKLGIDVIEVIKGASTKPFGFIPFYPGPGVGGHCVPVDPYYLIEKAKELGFDHKLLRLAREVNDSMPDYTVGLVVDGLNQLGKSVRGTNITILGLAYKKDVGDLRESPSIQIIEKLRKKGGILNIFDPYVRSKSTSTNLEDALKGSECLVLLTDHSEFSALKLDKLKKEGIKVIIDSRNILDKEKIKSLGIVYRGLGRK